jgi:hypothetical protein
VNRKLIFLNVVLLALAGWLFWMLRLKWVELHQHEHTVLTLSAEVRARLMIPPPMPQFKPMTAGEYNEVAQKNLFAKDRNPNVIFDPPPAPPPPPPPPPMPELPAYFGTMALFGDPVVVLKLPKGAQKNYHAGDKVGPFQLVSFNREKVVFDWNGKMVERKPEDLKEKESSPQDAPAPTPAAAAPVASSNNGGTSRTIGGAAADTAKVSEKLGPDNGGNVRMCVKGDDSPAGTIVDGYKKRIATNMFGATCMWEKVNP